MENKEIWNELDKKRLEDLDKLQNLTRKEVIELYNNDSWMQEIILNLWNELQITYKTEV